MTLKDIYNGWLVIGTSMKRDRTYSKKKKRVLTGSMGIGRFAAFLIANVITIQTKTVKGSQRKFKMDLTDINKLNTIDDYHIEIIKEKKNIIKKGTILCLSGLKWYPNKNEFNRIKIRLSMLTSPKSKANFKIVLITSDETITLDPKKNLPIPPIKITATFNNNIMKIKLKGNKNLYNNKLKRINYVQNIDKDYKSLKGIILDAYWYPLGERPQKTYWNVSTRGTFAKDMRAELSGVRLYRDGIRVFPYGEPDNDWLDLERT